MRAKKHPVNLEAIDKELERVKKIPTIFRDESVFPDARSKYFLRWDNRSDGERASDLGLVSRWLVAAKLLLKHVGQQNSANLQNGNEISFDEIANNSSNTTIRQLLIGFSDQRELKEESRFDPTIGEKKTDVYNLMLEIIDKINSHFRTVGGKVTPESFKNLHVPIKRNDTIGDDPIDYFSQWLKSGKTPVATVDEFLQDEVLLQSNMEPHFSKICENLLIDRDVGLGKKDLHQVIMNIYCPYGVQQLSNFPEKIHHMVRDKARNIEEYKPGVVKISLNGRASRRSVLRKLIAACTEEKRGVSDEAKATESDEKNVDSNKPIDLLQDLKKIRNFLIDNRVILVFSDWDNFNGPFDALHEYLCNTHWSELIRTLAQPLVNDAFEVQKKIIPIFRIVVLSSHPVHDLKPWCFSTMKYIPSAILGGDGVLVEEADGVVVSSIGAENSIEYHDEMESFFNAQLHDAVEKRSDEDKLPPFASNYTEREKRKFLLIRRWLANSTHVDNGDAIIKKYTSEGRVYDVHWNHDLNIFRFLATSINGMRRSTLQRCLIQLYTIAGNKKDFVEVVKDNAKFHKILDQFHTDYSALVEELDAEQIEGLSSRYGQIELDRVPVASSDYDSLWQRTTHIKTREWQAIFSGGLLDFEMVSPSLTKLAHVSFSLSEECLRQASAQMRHLKVGDFDNPYATRRLVQSVYHGIMSYELDFEIKEQRDRFENFLSDSGFFVSLPTAKKKRFRYLWSFLYKECLEDGCWKLGRAFGRADVRLDLLTMFLMPQHAHYMITGTKEFSAYELFPKPYVIDRVSADLLEDSVMRCDLLEAIGRAGLDHGTEYGKKATIYSISVLPGWKLAPAFTDNGDALHSVNPMQNVGIIVQKIAHNVEAEIKEGSNFGLVSLKGSSETIFSENENFLYGTHQMQSIEVTNRRTIVNKKSPESGQDGVSPLLLDIEKLKPIDAWRINEILPSRDSGYYYSIANSALKLRLDLLQSTGQVKDLEKAEMLCYEQFDRVGLDLSFFATLRRDFSSAINSAWIDEESSQDQLYRCLSAGLNSLTSQVSSRIVRQNLSDIMSRLAKIVATRANADDYDARGVVRPVGKYKDNLVFSFGFAFSLFWIADRLRSEAGNSHEPNLTWPLVGGRTIRYYIRVCLRLSRLIAERDVNISRSAKFLATGLLEHAQSRIATYTRHHYKFRKEHVSMLILEAARVRSWIRQRYQEINLAFGSIKSDIETFKKKHADSRTKLKITPVTNENLVQITGGSFARKHEVKIERENWERIWNEFSILQSDFIHDTKKKIRVQAKVIREQCEILDKAWFLVAEAEEILISLGFQAAHVRRLYLEQIKSVCLRIHMIDMDWRFSEGDAARLAEDSQKHFSVAMLALSALTSVSGKSVFWLDICKRQEMALSRAERIVKIWKEPDFLEENNLYKIIDEIKKE